MYLHRSHQSGSAPVPEDFTRQLKSAYSFQLLLIGLLKILVLPITRLHYGQTIVFLFCQIFVEKQTT